MTTKKVSSGRFAIDVGGTFTDLISWDPKNNQLRSEKTPTTPEVIEGVRNVTRAGHLDLTRAHLFLHGTTLVLNAILQQKGTTTGLITTKGFRDVLEIARADRPLMYDILYEKPPALVPRHLRLEVEERMNAKGETVRPLKEDDVRRAVGIFKKKGISSIAVCLLHSYANPIHEQRIGEIMRKEFPDAYVTLSHKILRQHYEYERTMSAVMNCQVQPIMWNYLEGLNGQLKADGFKGSFLLLRSSGGAMTYREAREAPIFTLMSGPAGGVYGGTTLGELTGFENLITADAGGTSFDVCLIAGGKPQIANHAVLGEYKLLLPILDIRSIGAGGGSIAWIDKAGAPQVGPQSAGANPGPICYGRGGEEPTVTDTALALGILNPDYFLGGRMHLDRQAAEDGLKRKIADPLGMPLSKAGQGILAIAETKMAGAIREISVERGYDPREFTLLAFGGFGPVSACNLARTLSIPRFLVPGSPANFSAWGMLMADLVHDYAQTMLLNLSDVSASDLGDALESLAAQGRRDLDADGIPSNRQHISCSFDMKYWGQGEHSVTVPLRARRITEKEKQQLERQFHTLHEAAYGHRIEAPVQIVNFRVRALGITKKPRIKQIAKGGKNARSALKGKRRVFWSGDRRPSTWNTFSRDRLRAGNVIRGPAIIEEPTTVTVVGPEDRLRVDRFGNLVVEVAQLR